MRILAAAAMLIVLAATAFAQDPNRNRMNEPYPETGQRGNAGSPPRAARPPPSFNRMNVQYLESPSVELTGGPSPYGNRMNDQVPKSAPKATKATKATEKPPAPAPIRPEPRP